MSAVRLFKVENRLAAMIRRPGGKTARQALSDAERRVDAKLAELAQTLPAATARLRELAEAAPAAPDGLDRVYELSNHIFALAAAASFNGLADAAYGLCDLIESFRDTGAVKWEAVRVHADAIRLLGAHPSTGDSAIAAGLKALGAHFGKRDE
jgi:hypothetical protein